MMIAPRITSSDTPIHVHRRICSSFRRFHLYEAMLRLRCEGDVNLPRRLPEGGRSPKERDSIRDGMISKKMRSDSASNDDVVSMKTPHPFIRVLLMSILAGLLVASAGMASAGRLGFFRTSAEKPTVPHDSATCSPDEGTSEDESSEDEGDSQECEDPEEGDGTTEPGAPGDLADREAECNKVAGLDTSAEGSDADVKTTGLDDAIEVVLANCIKNPQAPGLLNALSLLVQNRDKHMAHDAEKAVRRAARDAAKAARDAAKAARHAALHGGGHGYGGVA